MPDAIFANPRLAAIYDALDPDRSDLDHYEAMVAEFGARSVLDVGCGTGTFAVRLAARGVEVIGVDPAVASLDVARAKPGADRVRWELGDATVVPELMPAVRVDLVTMTANVAQVFLTDEAWHDTLTAIRSVLRPGGRLVFETRDPAVRAWEGWTRDRTFQRTDVPGIGAVEDWVEVTHVRPPFVTFRSPNHFLADDELIVSESTLRFRSRIEVERSLVSAGFAVLDVRDAPDRPGREFVFVAGPAD